MAKRLTKNQKEYYKQLSRIKKGINYWTRRGYSVELENFLVDKPKRVTKKLLKTLSKITRTTLGKKAEKITEYPVSVAIDTNLADIALSNFKQELLQFPPKLSDRFMSWYYELEQSYTPKKLGLALLKMPYNFTDAFQRYSHDYGRAMTEFESELFNSLGVAEEEINSAHELFMEEDQEWDY